jgi:type II restriction enzyme
MPANLDKPHNWKPDIVASVDMYNQWFMEFAPRAFRETRIATTKSVKAALRATSNLADIKPETISQNPAILPTLRMSTCPPLAVDRLIGLSGASPGLVRSLELDRRLPPKITAQFADEQLTRLAAIIEKLADPDIFVWLGRPAPASRVEVHRAATIVADRLCGAVANPIIRNAQEKRQLAAIKTWLENRSYRQLQASDGAKFNTMPAGTFSLRMNVPVKLQGGIQSINIPIDVVIMPRAAETGTFPLFIEAKSAGDFTNTNKRRKEEATKMAQLRSTYGASVRFNLFLCGYFDSGYLGYEAAEGIDWVWEHRIDDLISFGV